MLAKKILACAITSAALLTSLSASATNTQFERTETEDAIIIVNNYVMDKQNSDDVYTPKIVGGDPVLPRQYPHVAALTKNGRQFCGGSLIDEQHILTAAHCVANFSSKDLRNLRVELGTIRINPKQPGQISKRVERIIVHSDYNAMTYEDDIAIIELKSPVEYSDYIKPITLSLPLYDESDDWALAAGWGKTKEGGQPSDTLKGVWLKVMDNEKCQEKYESSHPGGIKDGMLCAAKTGRDTCQGDSGGPLFLNNYPFELIGIVSWGQGCARAESPGVYTRVSEYVYWIGNYILL